VVYGEDPLNPNYPVVATPLGTVGPLPTPASTVTGAIAFAVNANFLTPVLAPATGDVFLGIDMPQPLTGAWPTDGLSCHALYFVMVTSGWYDLPGAGHPVGQPEEGNGGWYVSTYAPGPQYTTTPRQWKLEPILAGATGVAGTITNQTTAPLSNGAPGTSSMSSGLHPDAQNPPLNAGRIDDIVSRWFMSGAPNGMPVFFMASFNPFGIEIPISVFIPGSGTICLDTTAMSQIGLSFTNAGEAYIVWNISAAARNAIAGIGVVHQSVGLDPLTNAALVNGCTRQIL